MKPLVAVEEDFACRDKSKVVGYFRIFGLSTMSCEEKNQCFQLSVDLHEFQVFSRDQDGRYQASNYGEKGVSISRWTLYLSIFGISKSQCSNAKNEIDKITIENAFTT